MADVLTIAVLGAGGRMGAELIDQIDASSDLTLVAAVDRADHGGIGTPTGSVLLSSDVPMVFEKAACVIDFSAPGSTREHAGFARDSKTPYVVGTTGLSAADHRALDEAAARTAVVQAGNFSTGVALLMAAVEILSARMDAAWDIEITDRHHRHKVDSPSGTALMLGEAAAKGRGTALDAVKTGPYDGLHGTRGDGAIGFSAQRGGSVIGEHDVSFYGAHERITLSHKAEDRGLFAAGALNAARFAAKAGAGRYTLQDVLGL